MSTLKFLIQSVNSSYFRCFTKSHSKTISRSSAWIPSTLYREFRTRMVHLKLVTSWDIPFWSGTSDIKFHPDQLKSVWENDTKRFCFVLTVWPPTKVRVNDSGIIIIKIIINIIYIAQFDTNGILTVLYIVITYIQMQYVHVWTYMKQSYKYTYTCLHISKYTVTCTNIYLPKY